MSGRRLRALLFDAGNTLLRMNYGAIAEALAAHGVPALPEAIQRAEWRARVRLDDDLFAHRAPGTSTESRSTGARYLRYVLEELGIVDEATVTRLGKWRSAYNPPVGLWNLADPEAGRALDLVRRAGLVAGVVSNSNGSVRAALDAVGLGAQLDFVLDSHVVGVEKPDPRIFAMALDRAGVAPGEAVYVGDLYSVDVVGARQAGLDAVLLDPGGCWGPRDCATAKGVLAAVRGALEGYSGRVTDG